MNNDINSKIFANFQKALNNHGYGFQYKILKEASGLSENDSPWKFEVSEFPVNTINHSTRIDFILLNNKYSLCLICECKRANPAIQNWCFTRAPFIHKDQINLSKISFERIIHDSRDQFISEPYEFINQTKDAYHLSIEIKTGQKGDEHSGSRGAIEEASTQVMIGLNGFVNFLVDNKINLIPVRDWIDIIPVIFTSANLWISNVELTKANLNTGLIDFKDSDFKKVDWLWYQYHVSPILKHSVYSRIIPEEIYQALDQRYARSIAIVNPDGLKDFLSRLHNDARSIKRPL